MKLQPKKVVQGQVTEQQRTLIKEGVELARKVDALRVTLASLEEQHQKFLAGMGRELDEATKVKRQEVEHLTKEVTILEEKKAKAKEPLDAEWAQLYDAQTKFTKEQISFAVIKNELQEKEKGIEKAEKRLGEERTALEFKAQEVECVSRETDELNRKAIENNAQRTKELEEHRKSAAQKVRELNKREKSLLLQADLNAHEKGILELKEKELNNKDLAIQDKYKQLLKTINHINNK